jgi:hypothetical protein
VVQESELASSGHVAPALDLRYLGPITAERAGEPVALGGPRQRAVLARLLVARGEIVTAERLADDLWAGDPPPSAANTLQSYISLLRRALGDPALLRRDGPGYVAAVDPTVVDAERFRAGVTRALARLDACPPSRPASKRCCAPARTRGPPARSSLRSKQSRSGSSWLRSS